MGTDDTLRVILRADLESQLLLSLYEESLLQVAADIQFLEGSEEASPSIRESLVSVCGISNTKKVFRRVATVGSLKRLDSMKGESELFQEELVKSKVNGRMCVLTGSLITAKNKDSVQANLRNVLRIKSTKKRWYELDYDTFSWYRADDDHLEMTGNLIVSDIIDIRSFTTDSAIISKSLCGFEVETVHRVYSYGCEDIIIRDNWVEALIFVRDKNFIKKSSYKLSERKLSSADVNKYYEMLKKQGTVYYSISAEDKKFTMTSLGIDLADVNIVYKYLLQELTASGRVSKLLSLLQELLMIPSGADHIWEGLYQYVKKNRESNQPNDNFSNIYIDNGIQRKLDTEGAVYTQVSKLALSVISYEREIESLQQKILKLESVRQDISVNVEPQRKSIARLSLHTSPVQLMEPVKENKFAKYDKMKKMLPEGPVRQKMKMDGVPESEINQYFSNDGEITPVKIISESSKAIDELSVKYGKMCKLLPEQAVRQKMTLDGISPENIDLFLLSEHNKQSELKSDDINSTPNSDGPKLTILSETVNDNSTSVVQVKNYVSTIDTEPPPENMSLKPIFKPRFKLKGLFWNKIKSNDIKGTIWYLLEEFVLPPNDIGLLEDQFAAKVIEENRKSSICFPNTKLISIVDNNRSRIISIVLGKFRLQPEDLYALILDLDPEKLTLDLTRVIIGILPTTEEYLFIKSYASFEQLDTPSRVVFHLNRIQRIEQRLDCHCTVFTWFDESAYLQGRLEIIRRAVEEVQVSKNTIKKLFSLVLSIGNVLNGDTNRGRAYGTKLDVFEKFYHLKSSSDRNRYTLFHYLSIVVEKHFPDIFIVTQQWTSVWVASEVSLGVLKQDLMLLEEQIRRMRETYEKVKHRADNSDFENENLEEYGESCLFERLNFFLNNANKSLQDLKLLYEQVDVEVVSTMKEFGEKAMNDEEGDYCQKFFGYVTFIANKLKETNEYNIRQRKAAEKEARSAEGYVVNEAKRLEDLAKKNIEVIDIFSKFHDSQSASTDALALGFKQKLLNKFMNANY